jgi:hypothetical protein
MNSLLALSGKVNNKPSGYWVLPDGTELAVYPKPTQEQIDNILSAMGWAWRDA